MDATLIILDKLKKAKDIDSGINDVLSFLGNTLKASRVYIFENTDDGLYTDNTYEWCAKGIEPMIDRLQHVSIKYYGYDEIFKDDDMFISGDITKLPDNFKNELEYQNIKAIVQCRILEHGEFKGFIGIDDCVNIRSDWEEDSLEAQRLQFMSGLLSMYLLNERSLQKLHEVKTKEMVQETLELVNDTVGSGIWFFTYDNKGVCTSVNWSEQFYEMLGYNEKELTNDLISFYRLVHKDDTKELYNAYMQALEGKQELNIKCRVLMKTGNYDWFNIHGRLSYYSNGKPRLFTGVFINITIAENNISDTNARLSTILGSIRGGLQICTIEEGFPLYYLSQEAAAIQGYTIDELKEKCNGLAYNNIYEEDKEKIYKEIKNQLKLSSEHYLEYRVVHKDGSIRWVKDQGRKIIRPDGKVLLYCLIQDFTDEKIANNRLLDEKALFRNALTNNAIFSFTFDLTDGYIYEDIIDKDGNSLVSDYGLTLPCDYDVLTETAKKHNGGKVLNDNKGLIFSRDGLLKLYSNGSTYNDCEYYQEYFDNYSRMIALLSKDSSNNHIIATIISYDITETKKKQLENQRLLSEALAQAQHANKAKTIFLNNMSHDIRTPMNAIIGYIALASTHIDSREKVIDYLHKIQTSSNHLLSLINDVLDMSRIESGKVFINETKISLPEVMHDIKNIVQADVKSKKLELFFDTVDVVHETVWCDKLRLNQIILNCLSNAIKFTPPGGTVSIKVTEKACLKEKHANFEFVIRDTGIGMSEDFLNHVFEPFERESTSTISGIQGTGLGMAITKNIVDMMGGTIICKSIKDKGTIFTISLCLKLDENKIPDFTIHDLESVHVLVADDDYETCSSVCNMLRKIGLRPEWTMSGKEALLRVEDANGLGDPFGVYIIDWLMADMNGIEVVRRIRSKIGNDTPIIILTAYDWTEIEDEAKEAGVTAFCAKPLFMSELRNLLCNSTVSKPSQNSVSSDDKLEGVKVLLVEDNEMNQEIGCDILTELGASVDVASDGSQAIEFIKISEDNYYDVILMDVQMPIMDGYTATKHIRALDDKNKAAIPIIAMTANAFEEDRKLAFKVGMDGHIGKPIEIDNLVSTVLKVIKKNK